MRTGHNKREARLSDGMNQAILDLLRSGRISAGCSSLDKPIAEIKPGNRRIQYAEGVAAPVGCDGSTARVLSVPIDFRRDLGTQLGTISEVEIKDICGLIGKSPKFTAVKYVLPPDSETQILKAGSVTNAPDAFVAVLVSNIVGRARELGIDLKVALHREENKKAARNLSEVEITFIKLLKRFGIKGQTLIFSLHRGKLKAESADANMKSFAEAVQLQTPTRVNQE
jgi:hypothetical protein